MKVPKWRMQLSGKTVREKRKNCNQTFGKKTEKK